MQYEKIRTAITDIGYKQTKENKKLEEFESPNDQVIYLYKNQPSKDGLLLVIHPELDCEPLIATPGVSINEKKQMRKGSNMKRYPIQTSANAENPIFYGRVLRIADISALKNMLLKHYVLTGLK